MTKDKNRRTRPPVNGSNDNRVIATRQGRPSIDGTGLVRETDIDDLIANGELSPLETRVARALYLNRLGPPMRWAALADLVYGPFGERPADEQSAIKVVIYRLRPKLRRAGMGIESILGLDGGYRLVRARYDDDDDVFV